MAGPRKAAGDASRVTDANAEEEAARRERGRKLFAQECRFIVGALLPGQVPPSGSPEVAFAGRSNVGKSSLLNALTGRRTLARVSRTPGRTRQLNFFALGEKLMLVDLPGYGYAKAPKGEIAAWNRITGAYLSGRAGLRRVCLLIDAELGATAQDRAVMDRLDDAAVSYQAVLTKCDRVKEAVLEKTRTRLADELARHPAAHPVILATSAKAGWGIAELRAAIAELTG